MSASPATRTIMALLSWPRTLRHVGGIEMGDLDSKTSGLHWHGLPV